MKMDRADRDPFCSGGRSLAGAAILPLSVWEASGSAVLTLSAAIMAIFIFYRHSDNIRRLLAGTEPVIWRK